MGDGEEQGIESEVLARPLWRRRRTWVTALAAVSVLGLGALWLVRKDLADRVVAGQLNKLGLPGTYKIDSVGPRHQVLTNLVIGDPQHPDLTVERAEIDISPAFGTPTVDKITLIRPRLYGTYHQGKLSFGALDTVLFRKSDTPFRLPNLDLKVVDGRARLDSDAGPIGFKAEGDGNLRDGFSGVLAAVAPNLTASGCRASGASLYGAVTIKAEQPRFAGPLRLSRLDCPRRKLVLGDAALQLDLTSPATFDAADGTFALRSGAAAWQDNSARSANGQGRFTFRNGDLSASYKLDGTALRTAAFSAARFGGEGMVRSHDRLAAFENDGTLSADSVTLGSQADAALAGLASSGEGTMLAPLAGQLRASLARESAGSHLSASYALRQTGALTTVVVPSGTWTGSSGAPLLTVSRLDLTAGGKGGARLAGNFVTGGAGMPRIEGRVQRQGHGELQARLAMAEYRAGTARIALPQLTVIQRPGGELGFAGQAALSGDLPGGRVDGLVVPVDGNWSARQGLAAWRRCIPVRFDRLVVGTLALSGRQQTVCPGRDGAILRSDGRGARVSAGTSSLALAGTLGQTPIRVETGALGLAWPGNVAARQVKVLLGDAGDPTRMTIAQLDGRLGEVSSGRFSGTEVRLNNVPLDMLEASGAWRLVGSDLAISQGEMRVQDRQADARFRPLVANDGTLALHNGVISAAATLREPKSEREVVHAAIVHELASMRGHADLDVPGLVFDNRMQPDTLTALALGVIANAKGTVAGQGRIDWSRAGVTSSGRFNTDGLDFAAAFGPVKGVSGTVHFTDLLGLVTAPDQRLKIAEINPGIAVDNGEMSFELQGNNVLMINGAHWPFIDGTLELQPSRMVLGASEVRRYTLKVDGINAAKFIERLELSNISATGYFDGTLPMVFDQNGGRIEGGMLTSRPPGGNVSYVGELTYKDMGAMANFAFQSLRSLDYRQMRIAMDGNLEGELVTRVRIDGVRQGQGAKRNFLTQRFAKLPIQFNINIRAPFQKLVANFRSTYDPDYIPDPRSVGLVDHQGHAIQPATPPPAPPQDQKKPAIQTPDSRNAP